MSKPKWSVEISLPTGDVKVTTEDISFTDVSNYRKVNQFIVFGFVISIIISIITGGALIVLLAMSGGLGLTVSTPYLFKIIASFLVCFGLSIFFARLHDAKDFLLLRFKEKEFWQEYWTAYEKTEAGKKWQYRWLWKPIVVGKLENANDKN